MLLIFFSTDWSHKHTNCNHIEPPCESFLGGASIEYDNIFNSNSVDTAYYYDKSGLKGTVFRSVNNQPYNNIQSSTPSMSEFSIIKKLELYPDCIYSSC